MFAEYDCFRLSKPLPGELIPVTTVGVILMVFGEGEYEVEFPDGEGGNLGTVPTFTLPGDFMDAISE